MKLRALRHLSTMRLHLLLLLLLGLSAAADATVDLPPPPRPYKILMMLPVSSTSHRNVFMPLAKALADRGHEVVMLSNHPPPKDIANIRYIERGLQHFNNENFNFFDNMKNPGKTFESFMKIMPDIAREVHELPAVKELFETRDTYDLIVIDNIFNELCFPFVENQTFITVATPGFDPVHSAVLGNLQNPATASNMFQYYPTPMTFLERVKNIVLLIVSAIYWRHWAVVPLVQNQISIQFPDVAPLLEIERNQSLVLMNSHFTTNGVHPLLPGQVEVGGMHCREGLPLPQDLLDYVTGSVPVVYFSLGSVARSSTIPVEYTEMLLSAFTKLPYKFIWKYEEDIADLPENIIVRKWLPQQDILAHPNVKIFISHCGLLSNHEAVYHNTIMLCLPIFGDQPKNAIVMQVAGRGRFLLWKELTAESIVETIKDLIENKSYQEKTSAISKAFKDQPSTPLQRAVFWTEYVIRHKGAPHLQSPEKQLTWIQLLHLDIILCLYLTLYIFYRIVKRCLRACCCKTQNVKTKRE